MPGLAQSNELISRDEGLRQFTATRSLPPRQQHVHTC